MKGNNEPTESWFRMWQIAVNKHFLHTWMVLLCVICMIPTLCLAQKITEFWAICYVHGHDAWDNGVRLIQSNKRELTDGSQLTVSAHMARVFALCFISCLGLAFWMLVLTYSNMKLHGHSFRRPPHNGLPKE